MSLFTFFVLMLLVSFSSSFDNSGECGCRDEPREYSDLELGEGLHLADRDEDWD